MTLFKAIFAWMLSFSGAEPQCAPAPELTVVNVSFRMQSEACRADDEADPIKDGHRGHGRGRGTPWSANGFWHGIFNGI